MEHEQNQGRPKKGIRKFPRSQQDKIDFSRLELEQYIESHIEEAIEKRWIKECAAQRHSLVGMPLSTG